MTDVKEIYKRSIRTARPFTEESDNYLGNLFNPKLNTQSRSEETPEWCQMQGDQTFQ